MGVLVHWSPRCRGAGAQVFKVLPRLKSNPTRLRTFNYPGQNRCGLMADQLLFLASFAIGIGPALLLLWLGLRRYTYPQVDKTLFDDRRVFFALAVGLVVGTFSSLFSITITGPDFASSLVAVVGSAVFEEMFKLIYLNRKGYRQNFSSTFYGFALGLGVASTVVLASGMANPNLTVNPMTFAILVMSSIALAGTQATAGALIGYGCSKGLPWSYLVRAIIVRIVFIASTIPVSLFAEPEWVGVFTVLPPLGVGLFLFYFAYTITFQETLPPEFRRRARKERRAKARKG